MVATVSGPVPLQELQWMVKDAVDLRMHWFVDADGDPRFADLDRRDLVQLAMIRALAVASKFDPIRGNYSTLIYTAVKHCLQDIIRGRGRETNRVHSVMPTPSQPAEDRNADALLEIRDWYEAGEGAGLPGGMGGDDETDDRWLRKVYAFTQGVCSERRRGPRVGMTQSSGWFVECVYSRAQRVAVALLMRRRGLSVRGAERMFTRRGSMRKAVGFELVPSYVWFQRARRTCRRMFSETCNTLENN